MGRSWHIHLSPAFTSPRRVPLFPASTQGPSQDKAALAAASLADVSKSWATRQEETERSNEPLLRAVGTKGIWELGRKAGKRGTRKAPLL